MMNVHYGKFQKIINFSLFINSCLTILIMINNNFYLCMQFNSKFKNITISGCSTVNNYLTLVNIINQNNITIVHKYYEP